MKYRKRSVVVEAFQVTEQRREDQSEWPGWLCRAWRGSVTKDYPLAEVGAFWRAGTSNHLYANSFVGDYEVQVDDYIVQDAKGALHRYRPDAFHEIYELVEN